MNIDLVIERAKTYIVLGLVVLMPIWILSSYLDPVGLPKLILITIASLLLVLLKAVEIIRSGKFQISLGSFDLGVVLLMLAYLVAGVVRTPNRLDAFFSPGISTFVIASGILYFAINELKNKRLVWWVLLISGVVLGISTIFGFLGILEKMPQLPDYLKSPLFNLSGDYLTAAVYLAVVIPFSLFALITTDDLPKKVLIGFCLVIVALGLSLSIFSILPGKPNAPAIPDVTTSWAVAAESIKENPVWGVGPANYISAFNRFRPITYNATNFWPYRFSAGHDYFLTLITETGLAGLVAGGILGLSVVKFVRSAVGTRGTIKVSETTISLLCLVGLLIALILIPASFVILYMFFVLLALNSKAHTVEFNLTAAKTQGGAPAKFPAIITGVLIVVAVLYFASRAFPVLGAEATFKTAFDALNKNDGKATYELLQESINKNPMVDRYHASYAQINLALARSIIGDKKDLSDDEKNSVSQLIQQAVREGQNTVALNQERSGNWEVLARIYQSIMPLAKDADSFAIQAYNQTIALDPINPNLRIALGGIYYSLSQWDNAISTFSVAIAAKPDLANAHYNLAVAYREKGDIDNAIAQMQAVLQLVPQNSQDYTLANSELESLQKKKPAKTGQEGTGESLTAPQASTAPAINPQLTLPKDATPPAAPVIPGATPTPTPQP
ncbi:MAG TPA: tetratricopeptide repeat protein [Patescibacteria group bacterium]